MKKIKYPLPEWIQASDLKYPPLGKQSSFSNGDGHFELWYTERFGWVIPTLLIHGSRRGSNYTRRSYGISVEDGMLVTVGSGPHILEQLTAYVSKKNRKRLEKKIYPLIHEGEVKAGECRDRISSRRANTILRRRSLYGY